MVAYNRDIPDAPNNPSTDQPKMKQNTNAIDDLISVDHLTFQATNFGTHKQTAFENFSTGVVPGGVPASVAYPAAGVAEVTRAQYYFKNSTNTFLLSEIRAFALCGSAGGITASQSFNVVSVVNNSVGTYTITLNANCTTGTNYAVFAQIINTVGLGWARITINSATQFTITTVFLTLPAATANLANTNFAFTVVQI